MSQLSARLVKVGDHGSKNTSVSDIGSTSTPNPSYIENCSCPGQKGRSTKFPNQIQRTKFFIFFGEICLGTSHAAVPFSFAKRIF
jgi:hypothetical protein